MKRFAKLWFGVLVIALILIITMIIGYFTSYDSAQPKGVFQTHIMPILDYKITVIAALAILLIFLSVTEYLKEQQKEELNTLKEENKEYRAIIKDKSLDLLINLKEMQKLHKQDKLREFIKNYTNKNPYVLAVQIYRFNIKHSRSFTEYRVNYVDGYVSDDEEVNAITQTCYRINRKTFKLFSDAYLEYLKDSSNTEKMVSFVNNQLARLNFKNISAITEEDCIIYSLVIYLIQVLAEEGEEIISTIADSGKEDILNNKKRTGLLRGIIDGNSYKFSYTGADDNKKNRLYVTFCKEINNIQYMFLLTFSPEINTNNQWEDDFIVKSIDEFQESSNQFDDMI